MNECPECGIEQKTRDRIVFRKHVKNCKKVNFMEGVMGITGNWSSEDMGTW